MKYNNANQLMMDCDEMESRNVYFMIEFSFISFKFGVSELDQLKKHPAPNALSS